MNIPVWLMWTVAMLLAMMPMSILYVAMKVDKVRPKRRRAKVVEVDPLTVGDGFIDYEEEALVLLAYIVAQEQMRQRYGKDIDWID